MPEAAPITEDLLTAFRGDWWDYDPQDLDDPGDPAEQKLEDWGLIEGRAVAVDYAIHAILRNAG